LQQALIEMQTFATDEKHVEDWLDRAHALQRRFYIDLDRYARAIADPRPERVRRFIEDVYFYDRDEAIIGFARALQHRIEVTPTRVREAIRHRPQSHYGQALAAGVHYLLAASAFFVGEIEVDTLHQRLDNGKPV
jgi:hypothetical protein